MFGLLKSSAAFPQVTRNPENLARQLFNEGRWKNLCMNKNIYQPSKLKLLRRYSE